jgi:hypothetical protein
MARIGKDQILSADDTEYDTVKVPEWAEGDPEAYVRIRSMSGSERDRYEESCARLKNGQPVPNMVNARARLVAWTVVDDDGKREFSDSEILKLGGKSSKALDRVFEASAKLSGITPQDVEELTADFESAQSESATTE